jgi:hypothetical protein
VHKRIRNRAKTFGNRAGNSAMMRFASFASLNRLPDEIIVPG